MKIPLEGRGPLLVSAHWLHVLSAELGSWVTFCDDDISPVLVSLCWFLVWLECDAG
jgi:hypothetical protein